METFFKLILGLCKTTAFLLYKANASSKEGQVACQFALGLFFICVSGFKVLLRQKILLQKEMGAQYCTNLLFYPSKQNVLKMFSK